MSNGFDPPVPADCQDPCPNDCDSVFERVHVSYLIRGGTRVMWDVLPNFDGPMPWTFQLQVGETGNPLADDWENVGLPMDNVFYAIDGEQRVWGKTNLTHYRVLLTDAEGTEYYSDPVDGLGVLSRRDWRIAKEIIRKETVRAKLAAPRGYLLKHRVTGLPCTQCTEWQTEEVTDPDCPECRGTGIQCGYYYPIGCVWADLQPKTRRAHIDNSAARGTTDDIVISGRMLMLPLLDSYDVWVNAKTDDRYYLHKIQHVAEIRGIPLIANVELRPAPFTDIIYSVEIPEQLRELEGV